VMEGISSTLCTISFELKDLVEQKKIQNELTTSLK